jgi:hypothetical protein
VKSWNLDIEDIEDIVGPADTWPGRCHEVALAAASLIDDGEAVYGHYLGPVDPYGYWRDYKDHHFIQHGWVELADGGVLDPTRWSFEDEEPEITIFDEMDAEEDYDKGGQRLRADLVKPAPPWDPSTKVGARGAAGAVSLSVPKGSDLEMTLNTLLGEDQHGTDDSDGYVVTVMQAGWLANLPYATLAPHQKEVYKLLDEVNLLGFVPQDHQQMAGL